MKGRKLSRRDILQGAVAISAGTVFASPIRAQAPEPVAITPALVEAAKKEGRLIFYSSMDLPVGEKLGKAFEAAYPGITIRNGVHLHRRHSGASRSDEPGIYFSGWHGFRVRAGARPGMTEERAA